MAVNIFKMLKLFKEPVGMLANRPSNDLRLNLNHVLKRNRVTTDTGAFLPEPKKTSFGILRVLLAVLPGLYLGATISKECAAFLEENDIFVPDEDDDED